MTVLIGESLQALQQPRKILNITYPSPIETLLGTPEDLPTSEPGTSQIIYTVAAEHLPVFDWEPLSKVWSAILHGFIKNVSGSARTLYWRVLKNSVSVDTGSVSVANNYYCTVSETNLYNIIAGDVLELRLWADAADCDLYWKGLAIYPTRIQVCKDNQIITNVSYTFTNYPAFTLGGSPLAKQTGKPLIYNQDIMYYQTDTTLNLGSQHPYTSVKTGKLYYGDYLLSVQKETSTTYRPYYYRNTAFSSISFNATPLII